LVKETWKADLRKKIEDIGEKIKKTENPDEKAKLDHDSKDLHLKLAKIEMSKSIQEEIQEKTPVLVKIIFII
jgi:hypothetical protein